MKIIVEKYTENMEAIVLLCSIGIKVYIQSAQSFLL